MKKPFEQLLAKRQDKILLDLWARLVKMKAGYRCEWGYKGKRCSRTEGLEGHHIEGRRNYDTRYEPINGACLCHAHHKLSRDSAHESPIEFLEMMLDQRGQGWLLSLKEKAKPSLKVDKVEAYNKLNEEIRRLE